jgi:hypothetical protein
MNGQVRRRRPAVLAGAGVVIVIGLAACGSATSDGTGAAAAGRSAGVPLCAGAAKVDQVVMRLTAARTREILPRSLTITAAPRVQALATALCALPTMPPGMRCPAALGGALRLHFTGAGRSYQPILIRDSGCASVTGVGPVRQWAWSSRPGRLLGQAAGSYGRLLAGTHPSSVPTP